MLITDTNVIVAVKAQEEPVVCRASINCSGAPGDDLGVTLTIEECCLNVPNSLGFSEGEVCSSCVGECITLWRMAIEDIVDNGLRL